VVKYRLPSHETYGEKYVVTTAPIPDRAPEEDIAERRRAKETELNLRLILDSIPAPAAVMTPAGEVESVNQPALEYFGKTLEDLKHSGTGDATHPDDLSHAVAVWREAVETGRPYEIKQRLRRFDGVYRWFGVRGFPSRDPDGHILNWCVLLTDIDDRERAEKALSASERNLSLIIDTIPTLAWVAGPDGSADFLNQRWLDYTGMTAERAHGWGCEAAIYPGDVKGFVEHWQSSLCSGMPLDAEGRMRRYDGAYRWFLFVPTHCETNRGKSSNGTESILISRIASKERKLCVQANSHGGRSWIIFPGL